MITGIKKRQNFKNFDQPLKSNSDKAKEVISNAKKYWVYNPISDVINKKYKYLFFSLK
jgi:hypothetical protein